jgi:hypothetical protein
MTPHSNRESKKWEDEKENIRNLSWLPPSGTRLSDMELIGGALAGTALRFIGSMTLQNEIQTHNYKWKCI